MFITQPGRLLPIVDSHLRIVADELDSCRRYNDRGTCTEDDFVFSLHEQSQRAIDADLGLESVIVKSGHVEIVGDENVAPTKLIAILQQRGILNPTRLAMREELAQLLARIYLLESRSEL
jgi:hypothetical protein